MEASTHGIIGHMRAVGCPFADAGALVLRRCGCRRRNPPRRAAQTAAQADEPTRIKVDVTRVNMLFTVTDKKGRFVTDLGKDDFEIIENNGRRPFRSSPRKAICPCAWAS